MAGHVLNNSIDRARDNWSVVLILSALFLFSTKALFNIPFAIMSFLGIYRLIKTPALLKTPEIRLACIIFSCLWFPMLLSLIDAENFFRSSKTVFPYIHFLFSSIFIIGELRNNETLKKTILGIFIILTFFCFDATLQFFTGENLFGYPYQPGMLGGMFYPRNTLAHFLALFSPIYFDQIRRHKQKLWAYSCLLLFLCVLFLGGRRSVWIMLLSSGLLYIPYLIFISKTVEWKNMLILPALIILVLTTVALSHTHLKDRLAATSGLFSGNYEAMDESTSKRLTIWETGISIVKSHWLNGIGPRGFRYIYADYASANDHFLKQGITPTQPHLQVLEVAVETGVIGLAAYLFFWVIVVKCARQQLIRKNTLGICWVITVMLAILPYNAHLAFYGSYWSSALWWVIPFFIVCTSSRYPTRG